MERSFDGGRWTATFRPTGIGRFFAAGFLGFWLCGWAVGELFAGAALLGMIGQSVAPELLRELKFPMTGDPGGAPWFVIGFLLVWLTFWTAGGIAAMREAGRLLAGRDTIRWDATGLERELAWGPVRSRRAWRAEEVRGFAFGRRNRGLTVVTARGTEVLTAWGTPAERAELAQELRRTLGTETRPASPDAPAELPEPWRSEPGADGTRLFRDPAGRRKAGAVAWGVTVAVALGAVATWAPRWLQADPEPGSTAGAAGIALVVALLALGSARLSHGRSQIVVRHGALEFRRRFLGPERVTVFEPIDLRVGLHTDSDGDEWFDVEARCGPKKKSIDRRMNDPMPMLALARWLALRTGAPLHLDRGVEEDLGRRAG